MFLFAGDRKGIWKTQLKFTTSHYICLNHLKSYVLCSKRLEVGPFIATRRIQNQCFNFVWGHFAWNDWVSLEQWLFSPSIFQECPTIPSSWRFCRWRRPCIFGPWPRREREKAREFGTRFQWLDWRGLCKVCTVTICIQDVGHKPRIVLKSILNSWKVQGIDCTEIAQVLCWQQSQQPWNRIRLSLLF